MKASGLRGCYFWPYLLPRMRIPVLGRRSTSEIAAEIRLLFILEKVKKYAKGTKKKQKFLDHGHHASGRRSISPRLLHGRFLMLGTRIMGKTVSEEYFLCVCGFFSPFSWKYINLEFTSRNSKNVIATRKNKHLHY